jgi:hypothetical protein
MNSAPREESAHDWPHRHPHQEARKIEGTNFIVNGMFKPLAVRDGNLITSQQQNSGAAGYFGDRGAWALKQHRQVTKS